MNSRLLHCLLAILCSLCAGVSATAQNTAIVGDMDGDGRLSIDDVTLLVNTILGDSPERTLRLADGETPWPEEPTADTHEYVDLGLPSGTLWATCNVGASAPEESGQYFAWGETQPKTIYDWPHYTLCKGSIATLTNYCMNEKYGTADRLSELADNHDAATTRWGKAWCMPTKAQAEELLSPTNTRITSTTINGINGFTISSLSGDASIFLPAAGAVIDTTNSMAGEHAEYWTRSLQTDDSSRAHYMYIDSYRPITDNQLRFIGCPIRPVRVVPAR